ncbi:MAG: acyltransferase family protein [Usitatibacter sp.]
MPGLRAEKFDNINLLRAFAALAVVVYHVIEHSHWAAYPIAGPLVTFRIGWLGVDLFFVISGFVISYSALILYRKAPAEFARRYWARRITRIVPLYVLTLVLWIAFMWPGFFHQAARDWAWQLFTHLAFIHSFWPETFGAIDGPNWSLAIEMQFYVAIALLIAWIDRTPGWRIWLYGILISWAWRACMLVLYGNMVGLELFMGTTQLPGVLDEFGAGIFLAKWTLDKRERMAGHSALWVFAACVTGYVTMTLFWGRASYWNFPGMVVFWRTALAVFLACVLAAAVNLPQVIGHRWLYPLEYLGEISYGIYLWHLFAVMAAIRIAGGDHPQVLTLTLAMTLLASALSWHLVEKPFMKLARR